MQQVGGFRRPQKKWRSSLILKDLECQLNALDASVKEQPQCRASFGESNFTKMDTNSHWAIQCSTDSYCEDPQERCSECLEKLDSLCQIYRGKAYCSHCFLKTPEVAICCACHHTIEGRVVLALGKVWHPHHLVCSKCEMVLSGGGPIYEHNGEPLCFHHFRSLTRETCHGCRNLLPEKCVEFANKLYCLEHFTCEFCDQLQQPESKLFTFDLRPICDSCYHCLPRDLRYNLKKWRRTERHHVNYWWRNLVDRLLCIYPRSKYERKRIPLNKEALPFLYSGLIIPDNHADPIS